MLQILAAKLQKVGFSKKLDSIFEVHKYAYNLHIEYHTRRLLQQLLRLSDKNSLFFFANHCTCTRSMILKMPTYLVGTRLKIQVNTANVEKIVVNYLVQALWKEQKVIISFIEWMKNFIKNQKTQIHMFQHFILIQSNKVGCFINTNLVLKTSIMSPTYTFLNYLRTCEIFGVMLNIVKCKSINNYVRHHMTEQLQILLST